MRLAPLHCKLYTCNPVGHAADKQTTHRDSALICPTPIVANVFFLFVFCRLSITMAQEPVIIRTSIDVFLQ